MTYSKAQSIKTTYRTTIILASFFFLALNMLVFYANYNLAQIIHSERIRYASMHTAYELLQNSDDLTMMARLYTVTGNEKYHHYFDDILAIRDGRAPRPKNYSPFYWHHVLGGKQTHELNGEVISITNRAKQLNFSEFEMEQLTKMEQNSVQLTTIEQKAFKLMQGASSYPKGGSTIHDEKNIEQARHLLHGEEFLQTTSQLIEPLEELQQALERRTEKEFTLLQTRQQTILYIFQGIILLALLLCLFAWRYANRRIVRPIRQLHQQAEKIALGDYSVRNQVHVKNELETLGQTVNLMCNAIEKDITERDQLNRMNEMLHTCQNSDEAYPIIHLAAQELFPFLNGGLAVYDKYTEKLNIVRQWGKHQIIKSVFSPADCWALRNSNIFIVENPEHSVICNHYISPPTGGYINIPLIVRGEMIGLLDLNATQGMLRANQQQLAVAFSENIKLALANIYLREALYSQAIRDGLTGLYNRRYLDETLPRELEQMKRDVGQLAIAMIDIDNFKIFNDQFGHEAGDEVLKLVGKQLQQTRAGDIACRYGGEEFVVILIDADLNDALFRVEEMCENVKKTRLNFRGQSMPHLSVSAGIATAPLHGTDASSLLSAADSALYIAKNKGKDRVEIFHTT